MKFEKFIKKAVPYVSTVRFRLRDEETSECEQR